MEVSRHYKSWEIIDSKLAIQYLTEIKDFNEKVGIC